MRAQFSLPLTLAIGWSISENQKFLAQYLMPVRQSALKEIATDPMVQWMFDYGCQIREIETRPDVHGKKQKLFRLIGRSYGFRQPTEVANSFKQQVDQFSCWVKA